MRWRGLGLGTEGLVREAAGGGCSPASPRARLPKVALISCRGSRHLLLVEVPAALRGLT